jgi:Tol biopolymer transport system component
MEADGYKKKGFRMNRSLHVVALALLMSLAIIGCRGVPTPTASLSPLSTSTTTVLPSPVPTSTHPSAVLSACQGPSDLDLGDMSLAFVARWDGNQDIYFVNGDGLSLHQFTQTEQDEWSPIWSPEGDRLAFLSGTFGPDSPNDLRLILASRDSSQAVPLSAYRQVVRTDIQWSPTGEWISFPAYYALGIVNADTGQAHELSFSNVLSFQETSWSPNGERIAIMSQISTRVAYWTMHTATRDGEYLGEMISIDLGNIRSVDWHPAEDRILFVSEFKGEGTDVYSVSADGTDVRRLTWTGGVDALIEGEAKWSPNADAIAYDTVNRFRPDPEVDIWVPHQSLRVMDSDGSEDQELVTAPGDVGHTIDRFEWAPDGRHIAYISTVFVGEERGESDLRVVDVCTGEDILVAEDVSSIAFSWSPSTASSSATIHEYTFTPPPRTQGSDDRAVISPSNVSNLTEWWDLQADVHIGRAEWSRDETLIAIGGLDGIGILDFPSMTFIGAIDPVTDEFAFIEGPRWPMLLVAEWGGVVVWDPILQTTGAEYRERRDVRNLARFGLSADGKLLASSLARDSGIGTYTVMHIWDVESGEKLLTLNASPILVSLEIAFRPDGAEIATVRQANSTVYFWDTQTGTALGSIKGSAVEYSPRGDVVATTRSRSIWLWDAGTKELVRVLKVTTEVYSLPIAFSPDGSLLAIGMDHLTIWETVGWTEIVALPIPGDHLRFLRFSPSGRYLASVNEQSSVNNSVGDFTVTIWVVKD